MTRKEMHLILQRIYTLCIKMDEAIEKRDAAIERDDLKCADTCDHIYAQFSHQWTGMESVINALGYKLVDNEGVWSLERRK